MLGGGELSDGPMSDACNHWTSFIDGERTSVMGGMGGGRRGRMGEMGGIVGNVSATVQGMPSCAEVGDCDGFYIPSSSVGVLV